MAKNYFYNLLLTLTNLLFPILSFPYVSRVLGPEGIGKVQFVFSFAQYFALIASIGIPVYGMKEIARYKNDKDGRSKIFSELLLVYMITSVCLSVIYIAVISTFTYFAKDHNMYLAATLLVLLSFCYIEWLYIGMEEFKSIALRSVLFKIIGLILMYLFIKSRSDFTAYLFIMMFSFLGNNVLSLFLIGGKVQLVFSGLKLRKHIVPLLLILGTTFATSIYTDMDTVLLGLLSDHKTVGLYTAAVKLSKVMIPFVTSMGIILIPKISKDFAERNFSGVQEIIDEVFRFLSFFAVPVSFGLIILTPELITLFSGPEFLPATNSMRLLSLLPLIIGFAHLFLNVTLIPSGRNKEMLFSVICGVLVSLSLNILLIPHLKEIGSSIALVCAELVSTLAYFYFIKKQFSFTYKWALIGKSLVSSLIFVPAVAVSRGFSLQPILTLMIAFTACTIGYIAIQWFIFKNDFVLAIFNYAKGKLRLTEAGHE